MKRTLYYSLLFVAASGGLATAQGIYGKVADKNNLPIEGVAVVLQTLDSTYVDAVVTDTLGAFLLNRPSGETYRLLYQHLLYEAYGQEAAADDVGTVQLVEKNYRLGEVTVRGKRPEVKVEAGKLVYDIPQLMRDKTHTNAFDVVKELPGVTAIDESLRLAGAGNLHIVLNGKPTTMSLEQLVQMLKSMPASRVQKAEVMYNAPARYNVKGALINVILSMPEAGNPALQGEAGVDYRQYHYASGAAHANLLYSTSRLNVDLLLKGDKGRSYYGEDMLARHTLDKMVTEIEQTGRGTTAGQAATMRLGLDYTFANKDKLSAAYYLNADDNSVARTAHTVFTPLHTALPTSSRSTGRIDDNSSLHNAHLQYDRLAGLSVGLDFTRYHAPSKLHFLDNSDTASPTDMLNNTRQDISRWSLFINHTHTLAAGWTLNYGVHGSYATSRSGSDYYYRRGQGYEPDAAANEHTLQKEYGGNAFAEVSKSFGTHFSASVGLKAEYFKSDYTSNGQKSSLWNDWAFFPTASLNYTFSPQHILQLNVSSNKTYPSYWYVSPQATPLNSYSEVAGNPLLKPFRSYEGQLVYIFRQKYMLVAFCNYEPNYIVQLPYQSDAELKNVFRFENLDHNVQTGFSLIVPFNVGTLWNSRVTLNGIRQQEKSEHFHNISFNNTGYIALVSMNNSFNLCSRPNLKLTVDGNYQSPGAIQGIYELGSAWRVGAGLKWTFAGEQASLTFKAEDLFHTAYPSPITVDEGNQWSRLHKLNDISYFQFSFVWKFGSYKTPQHDKVDTSRFGR